jgi:hypothetical protein
MTEEEPERIKRIHEAFRIRRENYGKMGQVSQMLSQVIPSSKWKDDQAKYSIAALFSALTLVNDRFETLEELDEKVLVYAAGMQDFLNDDIMPFLHRIAEKLDSIVGEHEKLAQTKAEVEGIAEGINKGMEKYADVLEFLENATRKSQQDREKSEEDRKKLEKGLHYVG